MFRKVIIFIALSVIMISGVSYTQGLSPEMWQVKFQREDVAPKYWVESKIRYAGKETLAISGDNKAHANGCWTCLVDIVPDVHYKFTSHFHYQGVENVQRSILARVLWRDSEGTPIGRAEYPATLPGNNDGWCTISQVYLSPEGARAAVLELVYRWEAEGIVYFGGTSFKKVEKPAKRIVRLATVHHRPRKSKSSQDNLEQFAGFVDRAGKLGADIVCLPEGVTVVGTGKSYVEVSEPIPGPSTAFFGKVAENNQLYVIAGIYEREDDVIYNTAVLLDRNGNLAGKYRKVCLPREEIEGGITPGNSFPTFQTDFGRIGMMICWDVTFPEVARALRMNGAEVIFMPIWGGNVTLAKARAIENQTYLVSSTYDMKSAVFDLEGKILVEATDNEPVVVMEVDLAEQKLWPWLGDFKNRIPREMPPREAWWHE
jgi:predicted amidohydrolase